MENSIKNQICKLTIKGFGLQEALSLKLADMFCSIGVSFYKSPCSDAFVRAREFYELSSKFHDPAGAYYLADMCHKGFGGIKDSEKALSLLGDVYLCNSETDFGSKALRYMSRILGSGSAIEVIDKTTNDKVLRFGGDKDPQFMYSGSYNKKCHDDFHDPCMALEILNERDMLLSDEYAEMYQRHACEGEILQNLDELHAW